MCVFVTKMKQLFSIATETNILYAVSSNSKIASNLTHLLFSCSVFMIIFFCFGLEFGLLQIIIIHTVALCYYLRLPNIRWFLFQIKPINSVLGDLFASCGSTRTEENKTHFLCSFGGLFRKKHFFQFILSEQHSLLTMI